MMLTCTLLTSEAGVTDIQSLSKLYMAMQLVLRPLASAGHSKGKAKGSQLLGASPHV